MKSGTEKKKNIPRRQRDETDMAMKALAEYEEVERRRYHERLRAGEIPVPPMPPEPDPC